MAVTTNYYTKNKKGSVCMQYNKERLEITLMAQHNERKPRDQHIYCPKCDVFMWIHKHLGKLCRFCGYSRTEILDTISKRELA